MTRTEEWGRWVGSTHDIAELTVAATELVRQYLNAPPRVRIEVALPGLDGEYEGPEEFTQEIRDTDLPRVERLVVSVGSHFRGDPLAITVRFQKTLGTTLTVEGADRTMVEGAAARLQQRLEERGARRYVDPSVYGVGAGCVALITVLGLAAAGPGPSPQEQADLTALEFGIGMAITAVIACFAIAVYKFMGWVMPRLEIVPVGGKSRWRRVRGKVWTVSGLVATTVAGILAQRVL